MKVIRNIIIKITYRSTNARVQYKICNREIEVWE